MFVTNWSSYIVQLTRSSSGVSSDIVGHWWISYDPASRIRPPESKKCQTCGVRTEEFSIENGTFYSSEPFAYSSISRPLDFVPYTNISICHYESYLCTK